MNKTPLVLLAIAALSFNAQDLSAQSPTPTPCPSATPPAPCPSQFGWAENLTKYTDYPAPLFPTEDTASLDAQDCAFHQWSWEAFVWATAIGPDGHARFMTLHNVDELGKKKPAAATGPKPLSLKPRDLKPPGAGQNSGDQPEQAGGGIVVDQNGQILWYSTHMNDAYFTFVQQYGGAGYAQAPASLSFPVGAAVFKASWQVVPDGTPPTGFYTEKTTVPLLKNKNGGGIEVDGTKTRPVTVALVGLHVVGVTANHPEFLWATFEQINNAPDLPVGMDPTSSHAVSTKAFTFYAANTPANKCNLKADGKKGRPQLQVTDPVKQTVAPVTNIFRQYATGGADCARSADINSLNTSAQNEMAGLGKAQPKETVWANYKLIGTLWLQACTLQPGEGQLETQGVASVELANSTLETFYQGPEHNVHGNSMSNCFMCHNTGGTGPTAKIPYPGKNINLSHALLDTIPAPTPTPIPIATPTATPAVKKPQ